MTKFLILSVMTGLMLGIHAQTTLQQDSAKEHYLAEQKLLGKKFTDGFYPNPSQVSDSPLRLSQSATRQICSAAYLWK